MEALNYVKVYFKCPESYKVDFPKSTALLIISVGQDVHEGEKFFGTIRRMNKSFARCIIQVDDSLQRFNLEVENSITSQEAYEKSIQLGSEWLDRNKPSYSQFQIPYEIIRWDKWLMHSEFSAKKEMIEKCYAEDPIYREAFYQTIEKFLNRYEKRFGSENFDRNIWYPLCIKYLKEECAAVCLWVETRCQFEIYPSGRNFAQIATYDRFVKPIYPNLLKSVSLYFETK